MRTYDSWKAHNPEDELDLDEPPEEIITCDECGGEGGIEKHCMVYEAGCGFPHDDSVFVTCPTCHGQGQFICERTPDYEH